MQLQREAPQRNGRTEHTASPRTTAARPVPWLNPVQNGGGYVRTGRRPVPSH
jgi:hypothetical protein